MIVYNSHVGCFYRTRTEYPLFCSSSSSYLRSRRKHGQFALILYQRQPKRKFKYGPPSAVPFIGYLIIPYHTTPFNHTIHKRDILSARAIQVWFFDPGCFLASFFLILVFTTVPFVGYTYWNTYYIKPYYGCVEERSFIELT